MRQLQAGALTRFVRARFQTTDVDAPSDGQLLECFRTRRDETAFELLVRRHGPMVAQVARRVLHDRHDAEDVYQAVFLVLARRANSVRKSESVGGWLHGVAYRLAQRAKVDAARRREREKQAAPKSPADPLAQAAWQELQSVLDEQIFQLPAACRSAVVLCYLEGKTRDEAAQQLGLSLRTLHRRLERGRTLLRLRLERMGLTLSAGLLAAALSKSAHCGALPVAVVNAATRAAMGSSVDVSARVLSLAEAASQMTGLRRFKGGIAFLIILGVLAAVVIQQAWSPQKQSAAVGGRAKNKAAPAVRKDLAGDPLPRGAVARLGTVRFRAPAETSSLVLSPDGKRVAVDSIAGVFLFDANSGQRRRNLGKLRSSKPWKENLLAFSPNGKYLAGRGLKTVEVKKGYYRRKGIVRLWDVAATKKPKEFAAENAIWLGWSAGGQLLVVCAEKGAVALHELANRKSKRFTCPDLRQPRRSDYTRCICAPDGQTLAVFDAKDILHVWDTASGKERFAVPAKKDNYVRGLAVAPNGRRLAILLERQSKPHGNVIEILDARSGRLLRALTDADGHFETIAFSSDGKTLAAGGWRGVTCWNAATGKKISHTQGEGTNTELVVFAGDGKTMATMQRHSPAFHLWDVATGKRKPQPVGHTAWISSIAFSPDGRRLISGAMDGMIQFWDLKTGKSALIIRRGGWLRDVALSRDGHSLFSTSTDDELWVCDTTSGKTQDIIKLEDPKLPDTRQSAIAMKMSADGKTLVALSYYYAKKGGGRPNLDTLITGWDAITRKQLFRRRLPGSDETAVSADARLLAAAHPTDLKKNKVPGRGPMRLENLATGEMQLTFPVLKGQNWPIEFSPDGRLLAAYNSNYKNRKEGDPTRTGQNIVLFDVTTASQVLSFPHKGQSRAAFSPDSRLLAIQAPELGILVWDLAQGKELHRFRGLDSEIMSLTFSPDGARLVSGHADSTLLVWDIGSPPPPAGKLTAKDLNQAWTDLAAKDAPRAFQARGKMAMAPKSSLPFLRERLKPARPADPQRLQKLIADLDSRKFKVRAAAQRELDELADLAAPALMQALQKKPTLEVALQIDGLLKKLLGPVTRPEQLRIIRAVAVLEDIANAEARALLHALAKGAAGARLTQEASAALRRLALRRSDDR